MSFGRLPKIVGNIWFNSKPLQTVDLFGKVVLIDFWTYSCVNCQRTLPYLTRWWKNHKYNDYLQIGVHSPEFDFEKDPGNVKDAIDRLNVEWPVVLDNDHRIWDSFANRYWPAKYLADRVGNIVFTHFGEGDYLETEEEIRRLLNDKKKLETPLPPLTLIEHTHGSACFLPTPELYCGYGRGTLGNLEGYRPNTEFEYLTPRSIPDDSLALSGRFYAAPEYVKSLDLQSAICLNFHATEVNIVLSPEGETSAEICFNGQPLKEEYRGTDVEADSTVKIDKSRMYNLVSTRQNNNELTSLEGVLSIMPTIGNFRAYVFTFSGCKWR